MITIYAKTKKKADGKTFKIFLTTVIMNEETVKVRVKFTELTPKEFPVNIDVNRETANMQQVKYTTKEGQEKQTFTLWIKDWKMSEKVYRDTSLDNVVL